MAALYRGAGVLDADRCRGFRRRGRPAGARPAIPIPAMLSPAALLCLVSGQSSCLVAAMLMAIFARPDREPRWRWLPAAASTRRPAIDLSGPGFAAWLLIRLRGSPRPALP
jgi:hypothetical protein